MSTDKLHTAGSRRTVSVIGAGPAGLSAAAALSALDFEVHLFDKEKHAGGKLNEYHQLFPGRDSSSGVMEELIASAENRNVIKHLGSEVSSIERHNGGWTVQHGKGQTIQSDAVIVANGFDFFDARLKEEFGYGIYSTVITSVELEHKLTTGKETLFHKGSEPAAIAFVHCVGSRDEQVGVSYCSRLCCITGIKQAIEMKELFPGTKIYNFYIDMRAFGTGYEELYRKAQEQYGVRFIRGRVSEASEDAEGRIRLKAEDTLMSRPLKVSVDWLVLLVGMTPACSPVKQRNDTRSFMESDQPLTGNKVTGMPGIFAAGCCTGPMSIPESVASGRSAAFQVLDHLNKKAIE
jgi:heterodisulfide reductase subunit A